MAVTTITTKMVAGVKYTVQTDSSADWGSVSNDTYFYDLTDEIVYYKNSSGIVLNIFSSSGISGSGTNQKIAFWDGVDSLTYSSFFTFVDNLTSPSFRLSNSTDSLIQINASSGFNHASNSFSQLTLQSFTNTSYPIARLKRQRGSNAAVTPAQTNDVLGQLNFSSENDNVRFEAIATENQVFPSAGGVKLSLKTVKTGDNFTNLDERLSIEGDGKVKIAGTYKLPDVDGTANQVIETDGAGNLSWVDAGGGGVAFSPINVGICDTAPTSGTTQYYYQTVAEITGTISKAKLWGYSGSDNVLFGIYRGKLGGPIALIGQGSLVCVIGSNEITLTAEAGQNLNLTAGEDIVVGFYPSGTSWRTVYDTGISDSAFGISNTSNISTMPSSPTGTGTAVRFALTLY